MKTLLLISNGHGEDHIAVQLGLTEKKRNPNLQLQGFPLVGLGQAYTAAEIPCLTQNPIFPSGGFIRGLGVLIKDLAAGLLPHIIKQKRNLNQLTPKADLVFCVGDIFALWMGSAAGKAKTTFFPTAKSDKFMPHSFLEKWLMKTYCHQIFTRDELTAENLRKDRLPAQFRTNPMMEGLVPSGDIFPFEHPYPIIGILPGSRDEAIANLEFILEVLEAVPTPLNLVIAKANTIDFLPLMNRHPLLITDKFADVLDQSQLIIGLAGTANEQAVYWGKTVISFPGTGPQTTVQRLTEQAKLLDQQITFINSKNPITIAKKIEEILNASLLGTV